jgi:hypothetical protein
VLLVLGIYLIALSSSDQKIDRYSLVFFQPIILIASIYIETLSLKAQRFVISVSLFYLIFIGFIYSPQYSAYYNPIIGGTRGAIDIGIYENGGTYFYDAANLLNQLAPQKRIYVPNNIEAFSMFYNGKSLREPQDIKDYVVVSLDIDRKQFETFGCNNFVQSFGPLDYKVVAIYSCK